MGDPRANLITNGERRQARTEAEDRQRLGDPRPQAQGRDGRPSETRSAGQETLNGLLSSRFHQLAEHHAAVVAPVVAPDPFVEVALKPLLRDGMMRSAYAGLEQAEEALDGLRVRGA